jgi:hypothetical protein
MQTFRKILRYWIVEADEPQFRKGVKVLDVTDYSCLEDVDSLQVLDGEHRVVAEFGPGKQYEGWTLSVEYPTPREPLSHLMRSLVQRLAAPPAGSAQAPVRPIAAPSPVIAAEANSSASTAGTGFILSARSSR